jgi:hypothetical protein
VNVRTRRLKAALLAATLLTCLSSCRALGSGDDQSSWCTTALKERVAAEWRSVVDRVDKTWSSASSCDVDDYVIFVENPPRSVATGTAVIAEKFEAALSSLHWTLKYHHRSAPASSSSPAADTSAGLLCYTTGTGGNTLYAQLFDEAPGIVLRLAQIPSGNRGYC